MISARRLIHFALTLSLLMYLSMSSASDASGQDTRRDTARALQRILNDSAYQTELPKGRGGVEVDEATLPDFETPKLKEEKRTRRRSRNWGSSRSPTYTSSPPILGGFTTFVSVVIGVILFLIIVGLFKSRGAKAVITEEELEEIEELEEERAPVNLTRQRAAIKDAEALAAEGRYEEAVHKLLLQTVNALRAVMTISEDLTAREIYQRTDLEGPPHSALYELLYAAELAHFGERAMSADVFTRCLAEYKLLLAHLSADA